MSRDLSSPLIAAVTSDEIFPALLLEVQFKSQTSYAWSGVGPLVYEGNTYLGVGSLGKISDITEGVEVRAEGLTVSLSGIDPTWLNECMTDIQIGAPASLIVAMLDGAGNVIAGYTQFAGTVDKAPIEIGASEGITISLALENRMSDLQRASNRRWTAADQHANGYPDDTGFNWVETLNDVALRWG